MSLVVLDARARDREALMQRARLVATGLTALGVTEGDTIALLLLNDFAFIEASQAASLVGAYVVPVNWHGKADEVHHVLTDCAARVLIGHDSLLARVRDAIPQDVSVVSVPVPPESAADHPAAAPLPDGALQWEAWLDAHAPWQGPPRAARASMIYTSGTTGRPKGVRRMAATPEQSAALAQMFAGVYGVAPGMRALVAGPLYHASPNAFMRQAFAHGEVFVMQSRFDPERTLAAIERHRITHAVMVPTMFVRLLKLPEAVRRRYDVGSLRWVTHTAAPCPVEVKEALIDWWGPVVVETYGGTEVGTATVCTSAEWRAHPGTVGRPTPGTRIAFYDGDGRQLPAGEVGEIYMRVPCYADFTYHNDPAKRASVERDGLISCGDVGYLKDGFLYLCDRKSDMVIAGGVNVYPAEIESLLVQCPGVRDCAVFGIPDADLGEVLMAAVETEPGAALTAADVRAFLEPRITSFKIPRHIEFHAALPREDSGKIFKRRLRDPYWAAAGRRI